jgi:signal transduction histidine kinase
MKLEFQSDSGMEVRDLLADTEFPRRHRQHDPERELQAFRRLAHVFAESPETILQSLVDLAVEFCGADSSGISLEERDQTGEMRFRWIVVAGSFAQYLNGTTPRFFSPCGTCLNRGQAQLYRVTKPYYDFLGIEARTIRDGILIPWVAEGMRGTIWAVSHQSDEAFDLQDYKLLNSLADFAAIAIRHQSQLKELRQRDTEAAKATIANRLAHEINNPLQTLTNTLYLAARDSERSQALLSQASEELDRLSSIVRQLLSMEFERGRKP